MMKKAGCRTSMTFLALLLAVSLLASCGGGSTVSQSSPGQRVSSEPYVVEHAVPDAPPLEKVVYEATEEILNAPMYSPVIQIGNTVLTFPFQYSELIAAGAVLADKEVTAEYLLNAGESKGASFKINETTFGVNFSNDTEDRGTLKDANATQVYGVRGGDIFYPLGIRVGTSLPELTEKWGDPTKEESKDKMLDLTYLEHPIQSNRIGYMNHDLISVTSNSYKIDIDRNTSLISYISGDVKKGEEIPQKRTATQDISSSSNIFEENRQEKEVTYSYTMPMAPNRQFDIALKVIEVGGIPYALRFNNVIRLISLGNSGPTAKPFNEELLISKTIGYLSEPVEVDVLELSEGVGRALGYYQKENGLWCKVQYITPDCDISSLDFAIVPIDPEQEISNEAAAIFKQMMTDLVMSIEVESITEKP